MQHYGIPTRLLDWTESLAVALYFASRSSSPIQIRPTIWILEPFELHKWVTDSGSEEIPFGNEGEAVDYADLAFCDNGPCNKKLVHPIPVTPDFIFNRLAIQNGAFTIHGTDKRPIEQIIPSEKQLMLRRFVASSEHVDSVLQRLKFVAPSSDALFPDLEGIREYIC